MKTLLLIAALLAVWALPGSAAVIISNGGTSQDGNVLFNGVGTPPPGSVWGHLNGMTVLYEFTSTEAELETTGQGQAGIRAVDGTFQSLLFMPLGGLYFTGASFNLDVFKQKGGAKTTGTVTFTILGENVGNIDPFEFNIDSTGQNFFTVYTTGASRIRSIGLLASVALTEMKQIRITPDAGSEIPEPASMALMGAGLVCIGIVRRCRK